MNNNNENSTGIQQPMAQPAHKISRKIGSTTYEVYINFSNTSKENMNDKIIRLIQNEAKTNKK